MRVAVQAERVNLEYRYEARRKAVPYPTSGGAKDSAKKESETPTPE